VWWPSGRARVPDQGLEPRPRAQVARPALKADEPRPAARVRAAGLPAEDLRPRPLVHRVVDGHDDAHVRCLRLVLLACHRREELRLGRVHPARVRARRVRGPARDRGHLARARERGVRAGWGGRNARQDERVVWSTGHASAAGADFIEPWSTGHCADGGGEGRAEWSTGQDMVEAEQVAPLLRRSCRICLFCPHHHTCGRPSHSPLSCIKSEAGNDIKSLNEPARLLPRSIDAVGVPCARTAGGPLASRLFTRSCRWAICGVHCASKAALSSDRTTVMRPHLGRPRPPRRPQDCEGTDRFANRARVRFPGYILCRTPTRAVTTCPCFRLARVLAPEWSGRSFLSWTERFKTSIPFSASWCVCHPMSAG
jgi:hypothetical protein